MQYYDREPELQDEVKHKKAEMSGTVIAVYLNPADQTTKMLDVRGMDNRIYWKTPAKNWEVVKTREELE